MYYIYTFFFSFFFEVKTLDWVDLRCDQVHQAGGQSASTEARRSESDDSNVPKRRYPRGFNQNMGYFQGQKMLVYRWDIDKILNVRMCVFSLLIRILCG